MQWRTYVLRRFGLEGAGERRTYTLANDYRVSTSQSFIHSFRSLGIVERGCAKNKKGLSSHDIMAFFIMYGESTIAYDGLDASLVHMLLKYSIS